MRSKPDSKQLQPDVNGVIAQDRSGLKVGQALDWVQPEQRKTGSSDAPPEPKHRAPSAPNHVTKSGRSRPVEPAGPSSDASGNGDGKVSPRADHSYGIDQALQDIFKSRPDSAGPLLDAEIDQLRLKITQMHSENKLTMSAVEKAVACARQVRAALDRKQDAVVVPDEIKADRVLRMFYDALYRELVDAYHVALVAASSEFEFSDSLGLKAFRIGERLPLVGSAVSLISAAVSFRKSMKKEAEYGRFRRVADDPTSASLLFSRVAHSVTVDTKFQKLIKDKQACVRAVYQHGLFKATNELWKGLADFKVRSNAVKLASLTAAQLCQAVFDDKLPLLNRDGIKRDADEILQQFCMVLCVKPVTRVNSGRAPTVGKSPASNPPVFPHSRDGALSAAAAGDIMQRMQLMQDMLMKQQQRLQEQTEEIARLNALVDAKNQQGSLPVSAGARGDQDQLQIQKQEQDQVDPSLSNQGPLTDRQRLSDVEASVGETKAELHRLREVVEGQDAKLEDLESVRMRESKRRNKKRV